MQIFITMLLKKRILSEKIISEYQSSNVIGSEYFPLTKDLIVEFKSGRKYKYQNVPLSIYLDFEIATSQGNYIQKLKKYNPTLNS